MMNESSPSAPSRKLVASVAVFVVAFAAAGYAWLGKPQGWSITPGAAKSPTPAVAADGAEFTVEQVETMVARLETRLQERPDDAKGWMMLGRAKAALGHFDQAIAAYRKVLDLQPENSQAQAGLAEVLAMTKGASATDAAAASGPATATPPIPGREAVAGRVELAPALAARTAPDDTVFIFARPAEGARMPLAILKKKVRDLPFDFKLDDSLAMSPAARLSGASRVVVGARVSKSGQAMSQPGDLEGLSAVVAPGQQGLKIVIGEVVP